MRPEPYTRTGEYRVGDVNRQKWTVEVDFGSWQEAEHFVQQVEACGFLPPFRHGPILGKGLANRVRKRRA